MPTNSREKGKRGEREFCRELRARGYGAYRSAQHAGIAERDDSADVITSITHIRFEVKRGKNDHHIWHAAVDDWVKKAQDETPSHKGWCVAWRPDRAGWYFFLPTDVTYAPWKIIPGIDAMLDVVNPTRNKTVENPDDWIHPESE